MVCGDQQTFVFSTAHGTDNRAAPMGVATRCTQRLITGSITSTSNYSAHSRFLEPPTTREGCRTA